MLREHLRFLPSPYAAIDFATDVRSCFIRRRNYLRNSWNSIILNLTCLQKFSLAW